MTARPVPAPGPARAAASVPASKWFGGQMPVARLGLVLCLLVPLCLLAWDARNHNLGVNAAKFAIHTTGFLAILCLVLSLVVTPVRQITGWNWLVQFRRSLGVFAFYYACVHLAVYFWWDRGGNLRGTIYEITHRYYLTIGFASLAIMVPLWATSFNAAIRSIGGRWWKRLHRFAYAAAALGCAHYYLQSKADKRLPDAFIAGLCALLLWRAGAAVVKRIRTPAAAKGLVPAAAPAKARFWKGRLKVVGTFRETASVRTFRLAPADGGPLPFAHRAGQFLNLTLSIEGKPVARTYTIASPPTRDAYIELTVKREENGQASRFLHDMLMTGHAVEISAPGGRFTFDPSSAPAVLLIAGGVGITPVMSILRSLTDQCWPGQIDLVFSVRSADDVIFADELRFLAARHPNLRVHVTVTRNAGADWPGLRGRITAELLKRQVPDVADRPAFVCGPDEMANAVRRELLALGVPDSRITLESFTPAAATAPQTNAADERPGAAAVVTFARSDRSATLTANRTVLDAAESVGAGIDSQCRSGICGTCRCRLLSGSVTMAVRDGLSESDEAEGYILACQARATQDIVIDA